ncbi:MAG: flavodoxin family protein [Eubacteriaceae bacterium]|uniref:Flavodoxin family protein n=1 Tax=Candidatus Pseudoramibacter fermentans TaxID=2594427 RepID=A0A6L5GPW0_9FIRM|nr:flavodoxin family protein [Candidatus Pseudoramibacter fermentans]RRF92188.1 MAG: flavodoxin family protein [Eubacteriaceae bacterium]
MKTVILNGSPRKGNTLTAINAYIEGAGEGSDIEVIHADKLNISGCKGCGACQCRNGCVAKDDTNATVDKIVAADMIIFATPVYWWGMTAQLKLVIDKCYCRGHLLTGKKIGVLVVGGAPTDHVEYKLIRKQFECMAQMLKWDIRFYKDYCANEKEDLAKNSAAIEELKQLSAAVE